MINYDIVDIRLFERVARYGQLKPAADQTCITVAAASLRIKKLEQFFNLKFFDRKPRGLELTDAGRRFLESAQRMIEISGDLESRMRILSLRDKNTIRLYTNYSSISGELRHDIGEFLESYPMYKVDFHLRTSEEVIKAVIDADADIGFANIQTACEGISIKAYSEDVYGLLLEEDNPNFDRARTSISLKEIQDFPLIALNSELISQEWFESHAREIGLTFNIRARFPNNFSGLDALRRLHGGMLVLRSSSVTSLPGFRFLKIEDSWRTLHNSLCMRSNMAIEGKPLEKLYNFFCEKIEQRNKEKVG